jgi:hypothetical protein
VLPIRADAGEARQSWHVLMVGLGEEPAETGRALIFTCDVRSPKPASALRLEDREVEVVVGDSAGDPEEIRVTLGRILRCGRPEYRPG